MVLFFFFKQKTAYEMRISDWSSDVCSSDLAGFIDYGSDVEPALRLNPEKAIFPPDDPPYNRLSPTPDLYIGAALRGFVRCHECATGGQIMNDHFDPGLAHTHPRRERKSVVQGKRVSVRVDHGGRRSNKK